MASHEQKAQYFTRFVYFKLILNIQRNFFFNYVLREPPSATLIQHSFTQSNPLNAELNPICHFLELLGAHHILHVSGKRVK
jgi:hypothetical protein